MDAPLVPSVRVADLDPAAPIPAGTTLLDVREDDEWEAGHAPGAVHIPLAQLVERAHELTEGAPLLVMCHSGGRSARATAWLNDAGYDAINLDGGILDWSGAGLPVV